MITLQVKNASKEAISFYGVEVQRLKAIEEMAELSIEFSRFSAKDGRASYEKVSEEIADVIIVLNSLYDAYNQEGSVDRFLEEKSARLIKRIGFLKNRVEVEI